MNPLLATSIGDPRYNDRYVVSDFARTSGPGPEPGARVPGAHRGRRSRQAVERQDLISWEVFKSAREMRDRGIPLPDLADPAQPVLLGAEHFVQLGSGSGLQPFKTVKDYDDFLKRVDGLVAWTDQAIVNMREGAAKGYTLPRVLAERVLPQLASQVVARPEDSLYWGPVRNMPAGFPRPTARA